MLANAKAKVAADNTEIAHAHVRLTATGGRHPAVREGGDERVEPDPRTEPAHRAADGRLRRASGHYTPRITVPIDELAQDYIDEGENAGVRGDVAFAQSILETGGFSFPGGGQVLVNDNNFAGIGACDSCKHGFSFADRADRRARADAGAADLRRSRPHRRPR